MITNCDLDHLKDQVQSKDLDLSNKDQLILSNPAPVAISIPLLSSEKLCENTKVELERRRRDRRIEGDHYPSALFRNRQPSAIANPQVSVGGRQKVTEFDFYNITLSLLRVATWKLNDLTLKIDIGGQKLFAVLTFWGILYFCFNLASVKGATQMLSRIRAKKR